MRSSAQPADTPEIESLDPVTGETVWRGPRTDPAALDTILREARAAQAEWRRRPFADRAAHARAFAQAAGNHKNALAAMVSAENGKPLWEARTEAAAVVAKVDLSIRAHDIRCSEFEDGGAVTRFRPHGVVAVLGPFNFPAHLPNGHIIPALLAGNAVVFKPSEHTPGVAALMAELWREAGLPRGLLNIVHGDGALGAALAAHSGIDGVYFTGSESVGKQLLQHHSLHPGKILALEMGGNNPLVVADCDDPTAAAVLAVQSAFLSAGQRCTCARRLILIESLSTRRVMGDVLRITKSLTVGHHSELPEPFTGPVISNAAADRILEAQAALIEAGARPLTAAERMREGTPLLRPGILDATEAPGRPDEEIFGPLLQVIRVADFESAVAEVNNTRFGLAAGLIGGDGAMYSQFRDRVRAGIVNWNRPLTGASGAAPFGGVGHSGNHRPSAFFATDYCAYPVASMEDDRPRIPEKLPPGLAVRA
ncbi:MAG: succinylglutamate-semialdehyde dehydrogenase [Opitutales bacterium]|nr:succinylglutamate-semialdehyde dehydrogenase [Opitutales bacterium]